MSDDLVATCHALMAEDKLELDEDIAPGVRVVVLPPAATGFPAWKRQEDMISTDADKDRGHADWCIPDGADNSRARILYLHGGGFEYYSPQDVYRPCTSRLAAVSQMPVLAIDYRLCPEFRHPAQLDDAEQAYRWISKNGPDGLGEASAVLIAGDSAGGGLTLALALRLRDRNVQPSPAGISVVSPETDLTCRGDSYTSRRWRADGVPGVMDPMFRDDDPAEASFEQIHKLLGEPDEEGSFAKTEPSISVLHADLHGLPPTQIHVGDAEIMLSDSVEFGRKAREAGSPVEVKVWPRMWHTWTQYSEARGANAKEPLQEAIAAIEQQGSFLQQSVVLSTSQPSHGGRCD